MKKKIIGIFVCTLIIASGFGSFFGIISPVKADFGDVVYSFDSPGPNPTGLTWDGTYLWNADVTFDKIYQLTTSGTVISSFDSPGSVPRGLTCDGTYLWNADGDDDKIYKLTTSGTVVTSFDSPGSNPTGLTWDGTYLWNADLNGMIYKLTVSGSVVESFNSPALAPDGLAWDGTYLWNANPFWNKIYKITTSGTEVDSFISPGLNPTGLTWDGAYLWNADMFTNEIYKIDVSEDTPPQPALSYSPDTIHFGTHDQGWSGSDNFEIWNSGTGTLTYTISESISWITSVNPSSGSSTGEHDTITVSVGNTGSMSGYYSGSININSDGESGTVFVDITINAQTNSPPNPPTNPDPTNGATDISINTALSCDVFDSDGDSMDVSFYLDGVFVGMDSNVPSGDRASVSPQQVLEYETIYSWYAIADDGEYSTPSNTWSFTTESRPEVWVLFVSPSDFSIDSADGDRFNNNVWFQYMILNRVYDIPRDRMRIYATQYEPSDQRPTYIDGDPTKSNAIAGLNWLEQNADDNDIVWIMMTDHGCEDPENPLKHYIMFSDGTTDEIMSPTELGFEIDDIDHDVLILLLNHCFSGAFIPDCAGTNHIIMTAVGAFSSAYGYEVDVDNNPSTTLEPNDGLFSFPRLEDHSWSYFSQSVSTGLTGFADATWNGGNGDGKVTMLEMFNYAQSRDQKDYSQLDDNGDGIANTASDGALAATVSFGLYDSFPGSYPCTVSSDIQGKNFPPGDVSFNVNAENQGDDDLDDCSLVVKIIDSDSQEVVFEKDYTITIPANDIITKSVTWQDGYIGNFSVFIVLYHDNDFLDGKFYGFIISITINQRPNKPSRPSGTTSGKAGTSYTYTASTTDPDEDQISYKFNWGDGTDSGWLRPVPSGQTASASHTWSSQGSFSVKVQAKDSNGAESDWSDQLHITMPRNRGLNRLFLNFLQQHPILLQLLQRFLSL